MNYEKKEEKKITASWVQVIGNYVALIAYNCAILYVAHEMKWVIWRQRELRLNAFDRKYLDV